MTSEQQSLVIELALKRVSEADFRARFGGDLSSPSESVLEFLEAAYESKEAGAVECALIWGEHYRRSDRFTSISSARCCSLRGIRATKRSRGCFRR